MNSTSPKSEQKPEEYALEYAGFWIRLGSFVIDSMILGCLAWTALSILATVEQDCTEVMSNFSLGDVAYSHGILSTCAIWLISWLAAVAYFAGFWVWRGQTLGKMVIGIKVIRTDSSPVTWPYAILRSIGYIVSTVVLFIGFIWIAFDSHKQGIHDKIADTYVVKLPVRQVILTDSFARGEIG